MEFTFKKFRLIDELRRDFKPGTKFIPPGWKNEPLVACGEIRFNYNNCHYYCDSGMVYNTDTNTKSTIVED